MYRLQIVVSPSAMAISGESFKCFASKIETNYFAFNVRLLVKLSILKSIIVIIPIKIPPDFLIIIGRAIRLCLRYAIANLNI